MAEGAVCRSCGCSRLRGVLDLGQQPLANALQASATADQARYRLNLVLCPDCALVQIDETVDPAILFGTYVYRSSYSDTMLSWARDLAAQLIESRHLNGDSLVIEAASNDGYLLKNYVRAGVPVLGIEPAANIAEIARVEGVRTEVAFFDERLGAALADRGELCDVFHAHNVLAHVPDPNRFLTGVSRVLKPSGVAVIEAPYVRDLIDGMAFDTVYHEHYSYFGAAAMSALAERSGLSLVDVQRVDIHGGSLRYTLQHRGATPNARVPELLAEERRAGLTEIAYFERFSGRVQDLCGTLAHILRDLRQRGPTIAAYGASAKGSTLLNAIGVGRETIGFVVDRSPLKQGRFMPGVGIPILPPGALLERRPDVALLLTWNFAREIIEQQADFLHSGGRFLIPLPQPTFVDSSALH